MALVLFAGSSNGMMDDPGLGWHLRIPDQMLEQNGFLYEEPFCAESLGRPIITYWFGDALLRLSWAWSGLNGVATLTALTMALVIRILYRRIVEDGTPVFPAVAWSLIALMATNPGVVARPNIFTFLGIAITALIAEGFHRGRITKKQTLWLLPVFLIWVNTHGGFLSGALVLCATYLVESVLSLWASDAAARSAARTRLKWWTGLGVALFAVTLINPYGFGLYQATLVMVTDTYIQRSTTTEWLPPDFRAAGWSFAEYLILAFPLLLALSTRKLNLVSLAVCIVWLHFGLLSKRYTPLTIIVLLPSLAWLAQQTAMSPRLKNWFQQSSSTFRGFFCGHDKSRRYVISLLFAVAFFAGTRWIGPVARHTPEYIPVAALNKLLQIHEGEKVFHTLNWGGYLTLHGWDSTPRFQTWIDDRLDVHSREHFQQYVSVLGAEMGWEETLAEKRVDLLCLPVASQLAQRVKLNGRWIELYRDDYAVIYQRAREQPPDNAS